MKIKDLPKPMRNWLYKYVIFRPAIVYAYSIADPDTQLREMWAYIGQTRQLLATRHAQHMGVDSRQHRQPWSDLYPEVRVIWSGACPDIALDWVEKYFIRRHQPLHNYMHNTKNPYRIPKYEAEKQRNARDRLARMRRSW